MFNKNGEFIPVTVINAGPCFITQIKKIEKDNYNSIQIGFEKIEKNKIKKSKKDKPYRYLKEFRTEKTEDIKIGDKITVDSFKEGDLVKISSISKGKGFQGVVKRHGFSGGPATHGHRHVLRTPGSIGSAFPEKVMKGKKMPGRAGGRRTTINNLKIAFIDPQNNLLAVKGAVSGPSNCLLEIKYAK